MQNKTSDIHFEFVLPNQYSVAWNDLLKDGIKIGKPENTVNKSANNQFADRNELPWIPRKQSTFVAEEVYAT